MLIFALALAAPRPDPCSANVVEYRHTVELQSQTRGTRTQKFRFSAPSAECESIVLPRRLNGMKLEGGDLIVTNRKMRRLRSMKTGQILIVSRTDELEDRRLSGVVEEPEFPVDFMVVEVSVPERTRASVWTPPDARVEVRERDGNRFFRASFEGTGRLVWSTETDWWEVGEALEDQAEANVVSGRSLPSLGDFVADLEGMTVERAMKRVREQIALDPALSGFGSARPLTEVLESKRGTAAERAVALITLLRAAGFEAVPVVVRPEKSERVVLSVPGLAPFSLPGVRVTDPDGQVSWIDPAVPFTRAGMVPRTFRGALALAAGDMPQVLSNDLLPDGTVSIDAEMVVDYSGRAEVEVNVASDEDASLALREILVPLKPSVRKQWLSDLITSVRPDASDIELQVFGVDDPLAPLGMRLTFVDRLKAPKSGRIHGVVPAALAVQLARVLPHNVLVKETLSLRGSDGVAPFVVDPVPEPIDPRALVTRRVRLLDDHIALNTRAYRSYRTPLEDDYTGDALFEASERGPTVHFFLGASGAAAKQVRGEGDLRGRLLEALFWFRADDEKKAAAAMKAVVKNPVPDVLAALQAVVPFGEHRPWDAVWQILEPEDRLKLVEALEAQGDRREAWRRATQLIGTPVESRALAQVARIQDSERPSVDADPEASKAWRKPLLLLQKAKTDAGDTVVVEVEAGLAAQLLEAGRCELAQPHVAALGDSLRHRALKAELAACRGELGATAELRTLIEESGFDPVVIRTAIRAWAHDGDSRMARRWAVLAARLLDTDLESWMRASRLSVEGGDLATGVYAARQASDLEPRAATANIPLQLLATLAGDVQNAAIATQRTGGYQVSKEPLPVTLELAEQILEPEQRLAFLRVRDDEVLADPVLLAERMALHEGIGDRAAWQRDAAWLVKRHRQRTAAVSAFRATADTLWSTHALSSLEAVLREADARRARMEYALFTGIADAYADARLLRDDPSAAIVRAAKTDPDRLLAGTRWPLALDDPRVQQPYGFEPAPLLSGLKGVVGFTNEDAHVSVLASAAGPILPPPVLGVFELGAPIATYGPIQLFRLKGQDTAAYVARREVGPVTWWGLAATPQLARFALLEAVNAQGGG